MNLENWTQSLQEKISDAILFGEPLSKYSWWQIGGPADALIDISSQKNLMSALKWLKKHEIQWCMIGKGTNLLFDDVGYRGCVLRLGDKFSNIKISGNRINAEAGAWTPLLAFQAARHGLSGLEHAIGIPASFGGLIYMNGGSQRKGIGDLVEQVTTVSPEGEICTYTKSECNFGYRNSRFQGGKEIITEATLVFSDEKNYASQRKELLYILRDRRQKFPRKAPSCGSVFKSSPELFAAAGPPGKIIESLGYKGFERGGVQVSPIHANFIVNLGNGTASGVMSIVKEIHSKVLSKFHLELTPEFQYVHPLKGIQHAAEWL